MTMSDKTRVVMRRGAGKYQYEFSAETTPEEAVAIMKSVIEGDKWVIHHTPFGEMRLINVARFDIIEFK